MGLAARDHEMLCMGEVGFTAYHVHLHYVCTMISGSLKFKLEIIGMGRREGSYALKAEWL